MHIRLLDGTYTPKLSLKSYAPTYVFSMNTYLNSPNHFFISIRLCFPNQKPITTYALVDSGATMSCISEHFTQHHGLS